MSISGYPKSWVAEVLTHTDLNAQFAHIRNGVNSGCLFKADAGQSVTVGVTFTATQTFTPAAGVGFNVTTGGVTIVGDSTITGTLGGVTTLTVGTVTASTAVTVGGVAVTTGTGTSGKSTRWTGTGVVAAGSIDDNGTYVSHAAQPRASAHGVSGTINSGGGTGKISWTEDTDVSGMHDNGSNPTRFTVPASGAGSYLLIAHVNVTGGASSNWQAAWLKNNATQVPSSSNIAALPTDAVGIGHGVVIALVEAAAADYFEVQCTNNTGSNGTASGHAVVAKLW